MTRSLLTIFVVLMSGVSVSAGDMRLDYLGYISVPRVKWDPGVYEAGDHFGYSRGAFCYIPERNSFLMMGHPYGQRFAEISNPGPGGVARFKSSFFDVTEGKLSEQAERLDAQIYIYSLLYNRGRVYVSAEKWYNVEGLHIATHGTFSPDPNRPEFSGWWRIGEFSGQMTGFYMACLPDRVARDGHWLLTGGSNGWRAGSSAGPCAVVAAPDRTSSGSAAPARKLLSYKLYQKPDLVIDYRDPRDRRVSAWGGGVDGWMGQCTIGGAVVIGDLLVYFGRQGTGYDYYGNGEDYTKLTGLPEAFESKGFHCGPYEASMWVYNIDALQRGDRRHVRLTFPWARNELKRGDLRGACVHGDRLYVCETFAESYEEQPLPVIHVLRFRNAAPQPR